ncbi:hypothetical protein M153_61510001245, partial [Pseudoloma neurophilia]
FVHVKICGLNLNLAIESNEVFTKNVNKPLLKRVLLPQHDN